MSENEGFDPPISGGIVVGHDGSALADRALAWAVEEARLRGWPLHAVRAWTLSTAIRETPVPFGTVPSLDECAAAVDKQLSAAVAETDTDGVEVHQHVVHGSPESMLMDAAEHADLLVVGERGRGGFAGLRLGSVAEQIMRHAPCTVVVVR
jgi:nucleotide-binding universal stress UspA family protein